MTPFIQDADFTLYQGDVLDVLAGMPDESVHCCVTSPPYWGLRDYGTGEWEGGDPGCDHRHETEHQKQGATSARAGRANVNEQRNENFRDVCGKCGARRVDKQLGLEETPELYVARMVEVFREVRRVLRSDGTCWLNLGDSYASSTYNTTNTLHNEHGWKQDAAKRPNVRAQVAGLKPKDLVGIPWRVAFALQADGWWLRSDIIWSKPNPMPESVTDRPTKSHEYLFLLTKSARYFYDADGIREMYVDTSRLNGSKGVVGHLQSGRRGGPDGRSVTRVVGMDGSAQHRDGERWPNGGRNKRSVWEIATEAFPEAHFATFPQALVEPCIKAGCPADGTVLDPFIGSGTTALVARRLGRRSVGIELNPGYCALAAARLGQQAIPLGHA